MNDPAAYCDFARTFTGCAVGCVVSGRADDLRRAKRYIGRAIQLYVAAGFTQQQAVREVASYVELLSALE